MGKTLTIEYDATGDFLFVDVCRPYAEQDSDAIGDDIVARFNTATGEIETIEILFFETQLRKRGEVRIPVCATLNPAGIPVKKQDAHYAPSEGELTVKYYLDKDALSIYQCSPYPGQTRKRIGDKVVARLNPSTGEIECLEIRSFKARMERDGEIVLPLNATLRPSKRAVTAD